MKRLVPVVCMLLAALCAWLGITVRSLSREADDLRDQLLSSGPPAAVDAAPVGGAGSPAPPAPLSIAPTPPVDAAPAAPVRPTLSGAPPAPKPDGERPDAPEVVAFAPSVVLRARNIVWSSSEGATIHISPQPVASLDDMEGRLTLSRRQRYEIERVVADAKRDLADLRRTPDEAGRTWEQVQRDAVRMEDGVRIVDDSETLAFRGRRLPGSEETYGAAEKRILDAAKVQMGEALDADQNQKFSNMDPTPILGPRPPGAPHEAVSLIYVPSTRSVGGVVDVAGSTSGAEGR